MSINMDDFEKAYIGKPGVSAMPSWTEPESVEPPLSDKMDNVMFERIADLRDRIADLNDVIEWLKTFGSFDEEEMEALEVMKRSLQETLNEIRRKMDSLNDSKRRLKNTILPYSRRLEEMQREWARLMAELDAQQRERAQKAQLELLTENAPWRDRALKHQWEGAYRLSSAERAILGDKPGLGKTLQAIMTVDMLKALGNAHKVLIFCPKSVLDGFEREFKKFSPDQFVFVVDQAGGAKEHVLDVAAAMPVCTILMNYEIWRKNRKIIDKIKQCQFDTIVLDEAHTLKNKNTGTAKGIREIVYADNKCSDCGSLCFDTSCPKCGNRSREIGEFCSVKNVFPMTGTPILNKPQDLYTMLNLIDRVGFPTENDFLYDFCTKKCAVCKRQYGCECDSATKKMVWTFDHGGEERLLSRLGFRYTARTRESAGVEMPPQEVIHHNFDLDPEEYPKQYEFQTLLRENARLKFGEGKTVTSTDMIAWYTRMRQSAIWADGIRFKEYHPITQEFIKEWAPETGESLLMDRGEEIIREALENGERIVVFSKFKKALIEMERRLLVDNVPVVRFDGDLNADRRLEAQHDFDLTITDPKKAKFKVMLVQYETGKQGLNLHGANEVLLLDREWNPAMEEQAINRVRRIGSVNDSRVHILHCAGTATELMDAIIEMKLEMRDGFDIENDKMEAAMRKFLEGK